MTFRRLASVFQFLLCSAWAQQDKGVITGLVTDPSSAAVAGAAVTVVNRETNEVWNTETGATGTYTAGPLRVGRYNVTVEKAGFSKTVWEDIELHAQDRVRADFKLQVGQVSETVAVRAEAPLLQVETSSLAHVVEQREIRGLPLNGRSFQRLAWLSAGVAPNTLGRDRDSGFNSHGQQFTQNSFQIDGIDNFNHAMGIQDLKLQAVVPALDAVAEFKVQTSNYSAEFGRNSGAVLMINIKSGSNDLHGTAFEYLRNDIFDSRDKFSYLDRNGDGRADPELLRENLFGGTLGGAIRKNRTFFFGSWEGRRDRRAQIDPATVPTSDERNGIFATSLAIVRDPVTNQPFAGNRVPRDRFDSTSVRLLDLWPLPNLSNTGSRNNYGRNPPWTLDRDQIDARVDHNFSANDRAFVRFSMARFHERRESVFTTPARGDRDGFRNNSNNPARSLALSYTRIITPNLLNEFRYGLSRLQSLWSELSSEKFSDLTAQYGLRGFPQSLGDRIFGLPQFTFGGSIGYTGLGEPGSMPNFKVSQVHQYVNNVSWNHRNHNIRFGPDIRFNRSDCDIGTNAHGVFSFSGQYTAISFADFLLGRVATTSLATWLTCQMRFRDYMFYFQDDWKVTPKLTLNLGLRYELDTPWYDKHNHMSQLDLTPGANFGNILYACGDSYSCRGLVNLDNNNWAPRLGLAYQLQRRTVLRSGAGVFYAGQGALGANGRPLINFPFTNAVTSQGTPTQPALQLNAGLPPNFLGSPTTPPPNLNWQVWATNFPLPTIYQWNLAVQHEVMQGLSLTVAYVGSSSNYVLGSYNWNGSDIGPPATEQARRRIPTWNTITLTSPYAHSSYHGMDVQLERRYSKGLSFTASYTWGHSIDNVAELLGSGGGGLQYVRDFNNSRGNSNFDYRHRFVTGMLWEMPFGKGRQGVVNRVLGGWQLSSILWAQTGHHFTPSVSNPIPRLGASSVAGWRPDRIADGRLATRTADRWFDTSALVLPRDAAGNFRLGSAGRSILVGDGPFNWDAGLLKSFAITERLQLQFRGEVFNLTNTPTLGDPTANIESPDYGKVRGTTSSPRQFQFALRLSF